MDIASASSKLMSEQIQHLTEAAARAIKAAAGRLLTEQAGDMLDEVHNLAPPPSSQAM